MITLLDGQTFFVESKAVWESKGATYKHHEAIWVDLPTFITLLVAALVAADGLSDVTINHTVPPAIRDIEEPHLKGTFMNGPFELKTRDGEYRLEIESAHIFWSMVIFNKF